MNPLETKFTQLGTDNAPGQEGRQKTADLTNVLRGEPLAGQPVDFSHGDVDAFTPTPGAFDAFTVGVQAGGQQAYTEYRGKKSLREMLAARLAAFTGAGVSAQQGLILTPGSQGALFLAMAACAGAGDMVAIVQPDYFANRKLVQFLDAQVVPVRLNYLGNDAHAGLDLSQLEDAFKGGARLFVFSNPNNPTGAVYSSTEIATIARLAREYGATVIVDQLYSRLLYAGQTYTHLRADLNAPDNLVTVMGPSKTESLSGYRLGVAFGTAALIDRMEKLQAIVSLRAPGYCQAVLQTWFAEPAGWLQERIEAHQRIRDALLAELRAVAGVQVRTPQAGSYLFVQLPEMAVAPQTFVALLRHQAAVTVTPGAEFGPHTCDSFRLNFSQDHDAAVHAVQRVCALIERYCV
ncbi:MAG: aspartate aminotransferase [Comamonadaceae bacterium CG1_02_60_18]|nr:MAG: aspartate aminotransferase [Comamonadaceae bacterium CG1_02_60_18]PIQ50951.1 MAG: aspartate aminotransferase [Comamonadaceae bacterium CG12_big_fil_rev_8_21_14_0_65_59_15]